MLLSLFARLCVCCSAIFFATAVDPGEYSFVDLRNSNIKVKDLRVLLDKRGLPYFDFHEKSEFINALRESGPLTVGELKKARASNPGKWNSLSDDIMEELVADVKFEKNVPENVLNSKQEIWLVQIVPKSGANAHILEDATWRRLIATFGPFEVQFGRFNCRQAGTYCDTKGWSSSALVLVIPRLHDKGHLSTQAEAFILKTTKNANDEWIYEVDSVVKQVYSLMHMKLVRYLPAKENFEGLQTKAFECSVHFVLLTDSINSPFLLSSLAAKFNYGTHCFALGPKKIVDSTLIKPDNQVDAFFAFKSHFFYNNNWQIVPHTQPISGVDSGVLNAMVTFESLSGLLNELSSIDAKKPKFGKIKTPKTEKKPPRPPKYEYSYGYSGSQHKPDFYFYLKFVGGLLLFIGLPVAVHLVNDRNAEKRRQEEYARYRSNIRNRERSYEQNFWRDLRQEVAEDEEEEVRDEMSSMYRSTSFYNSNLNNNEEIPLRSFEDYFSILTLRLSTEWHKLAFDRFNLRRYLNRKMEMLLAHYGINFNEIGFPPYNWILNLPTVEMSDLPENLRLSSCPICQYSIDSSDEELCRMPCNCREIIYHYDCIAPWLIKREDQNSHSFTSGKLHTERPCPTCRFDFTTWGLRQHSDD